MKLRFTFLLFFVVQCGFCQGHVVIPSFKSIAQQRSLWCWAASIQMIDNYQKSYDGSAISQCRIVGDIYIPIRISKGPNLATRLGIATTPTDFKCCENLCSSTLKLEDGNLELTPPTGYTYLKIYLELFSTLGYNSQGNSGMLAWVDVKTLINKNSPFIISNVNYKGIFSDADFPHVVASNGYYSGSIRLVRINDPWEVCSANGCIYYFNYDLLGCNNIGCSDIIKKVVSIYDIRKTTTPITPSIITTPNPPSSVGCLPLKNESSKALAQKVAQKLIDDGDLQFLDEIGLKGVTSQDLIGISPVKISIISKSKLNLQIVTPNNANGDYYEPIERQVCNVKKQQGSKVSSIFVVKKSDCMFFYFESISTCSWMGRTPPQQIILDGQTVSTPSKYSIITCEPYQNAFYDVSVNAKKYLIPVLDYPTLQLKANTAYTADAIFNILKNKVY